MDPFKAKKIILWGNRILSIILSVIVGLFSLLQGNDIKQSFINLLLLALTIVVINCGLEFLIQLMNTYGICNAFDLIFFIDFIPTFSSWIKKSISKWENVSGILFLFLITVFFIWFSSLKWEVPIEDNNLYVNSKNRFFNERSEFKLGFKVHFSFISLYYLSQFISFCLRLILMWIYRQEGWFSFSGICKLWSYVDSVLKLIGNGENGDILWKKPLLTIFNLNEVSNVFNFQTLENLFKMVNWKIIILSLFSLVMLRLLVLWFSISRDTLNAREITKDLRSRGIYIDGVAPSHETQKLLDKVTRKIILFWFVLIILFNIVFDNLICNKMDDQIIRFNSWFSCVGIGIELLRQIYDRTRYLRNK